MLIAANIIGVKVLLHDWLKYPLARCWLNDAPIRKKDFDFDSKVASTSLSDSYLPQSSSTARQQCLQKCGAYDAISAAARGYNLAQAAEPEEKGFRMDMRALLEPKKHGKAQSKPGSTSRKSYLLVI